MSEDFKFTDEAPKRVAVFFVTLSLFAVLALRSPFSGAWKFLLGMIFSFLSTYLIFRNSKAISYKGLLPALLAALLCTSDNVLILGRIRWGEVLSTLPYIRAPFNLDFERNLILVKALLRDGLSPFLPDSPMHYQTFWHSWASLWVGAFPFSAFRMVGFCTWLTAFLFYFSVYCFLDFWLCDKKNGQAWKWILLVFLATHSEIANLLLSVMKAGTLGMEADWSTPFPIYFRFISFKLLSLIAPQHLLFLWFFLFLVRYKRGRSTWLIFSLCVCFLSSPILSLLGAVPVILWDKQFFSRVKTLFIALALSAICYSLFFGQNLFSYFSQKRSDEIWILPLNLLPELPWIWILTSGALGALTTVFFVLWLKRQRNFEEGVYWLLLLGLALVPNFIFSNAELRRHSSMLICALSFLTLLSFGREKWSLILGRIFVGAALISHFYFVYSYLFKNTALDPEIPYRDYFAMNEVIEEKYPNLPVIAACDSRYGVELPIVLEATKSFVLPLSAFVHGKVSEEQSQLLKRVENLGHILPVARELGYQAILWGPLEEKIWHPRVKARFVREDHLIVSVGSVRLYRLQDSIRDIEKEPLQLAQKLEENGWGAEALEIYLKIALADPKGSASQKAQALKLRLGL